MHMITYIVHTSHWAGRPRRRPSSASPEAFPSRRPARRPASAAPSERPPFARSPYRKSCTTGEQLHCTASPCQRPGRRTYPTSHGRRNPGGIPCHQGPQHEYRYIEGCAIRLPETSVLRSGMGRREQSLTPACPMEVHFLPPRRMGEPRLPHGSDWPASREAGRNAEQAKPHGLHPLASCQG